MVVEAGGSGERQGSGMVQGRASRRDLGVITRLVAFSPLRTRGNPVPFPLVFTYPRRARLPSPKWDSAILPGATVGFAEFFGMRFQHVMAAVVLAMLIAPSVALAQSGRCCNTSSGACSITTAPTCVGGSWSPGGTCVPNPCPQPTGSCCIGSACTATDSSHCSGSFASGGACSPAACVATFGVCCTAPGGCTFDHVDGQISHLGGAAPNGAKAADDFTLALGALHQVNRVSARLLTTTTAADVAPVAEIWSDSPGCPGTLLYTLATVSVIETGQNFGTAFDGRILRIVDVSWTVALQAASASQVIVLPGGTYWLSVYGQSDNLGAASHMYDVTYWGTTGAGFPVVGSPAFKINGNPGQPAGSYSFPTGCSSTAWQSVAATCCLSATDLNFELCTIPVQPGTCCSSNGSCTFVAPVACASGSVWASGGTCTPNTCPTTSCGTACPAGSTCSTINGGFETGDLSGWTNTDPTYTSVPSGTGPGGQVAHSGTHFLSTGPTVTPAAEGISQTISANPGDIATISYYYSNDTRNMGLNEFKVVFDGVTLIDLVNDAAHSAWTRYTFTAMVTHANPTLSFLVYNGPAWDGIDDVSVCVVSSPRGVCCRGATCNAAIADQATCLGSIPAGSPAGVVWRTGSTACDATGNSTTPCCYADFDKNGTLTIADIFSFLSSWFAGSPFAKIGGDGSSGSPVVGDVFAFLSDWFAGGC